MPGHEPPPRPRIRAAIGVARLRWPLLPITLTVVAIALIWSGIVLHLSEQRDQAIRNAIDLTGNLAHAFEETVARTIGSVDQLLVLLRATYAHDPAGFDLTTWARNSVFLNDFTLQISIVGPDGAVRMSNLGPVTTRVDLSDREHIRVQLDGDDDRLFISRPVMGRVSGRLSLNCSRKILDAKGRTIGVVVGSLDPFYLSRFYTGIDLPGGSVNLIGTDGIIRARAPDTKSIGGGLGEGSPLLALAAKAPRGWYRSISAVYAQPRIHSYRKLAAYPMIVVVGQNESEVLAGYWRVRRAYLCAGALATLLVLAVGLLLVRQHQRLRHSRERLSLMLENMNQGIMLVDADRRVQMINGRAAGLLGLPDHLTTGPPQYDDILAWQIANGEFAPGPATPDAVWALVRAGGFAEGSNGYERTRPDGTVLDVRTMPVPSGGWVRTYTDITERKKIEQDLARALDAAAAADRARARFLSTMSHEIRTPIGEITGVSGLLIDMPLDATARGYAEIIRESSNHLLALVNDVLDFAMLESAGVVLEQLAFDVRAAVGSAIDPLLRVAGDKGLTLTLEITSDVPRRVVGDQGRLRQILHNLVGNGLKFTNQGSVAVRVDLGPAPPESERVRLLFEVHDTGIGIPEAARARLFTGFTQVDGSRSRRHGGTGLGLAICQRLVERMGGAIVVESIPGTGSVFRFDILVEPDTVMVPPAAGSASAAAPAAAAAAAEPEPAAGLRVLIVEDNATNCLIALRMVERLGHSADTVVNGLEAVRAVRRAPYDLVLMDLMMPEMDGLSASRAIRDMPPPVGSIPIIGLTANVTPSDEAACRAAGMNAYVPKPFTIERLGKAITQVIRSRRGGWGAGLSGAR